MRPYHLTTQKMDFSLDVSEEWLNRRRELTAQASRKVRQKKKQEREVLLEENKDLRKEQAFYAMQISELEKLPPLLLSYAHYEIELARENQLLRDELALHQAFLNDVFTQLAKTEPREGAMMRELSKQTREMNMLHAMRILADSQYNTRRNWYEVNLQCDLMENPHTTLYSVGLRYAICSNGNLEIRADACFSGEISPDQLQEAMTVNWCAKRCFNNDFEENHVVSSNELIDFRVEGAQETLQAFYRKVKMRGTQPNHPQFREAIILVAKGIMPMAKSTLVIGGGNNANCREITKRMRTSETPPVGLTESQFAFRYVFCAI